MTTECGNWAHWQRALFIAIVSMVAGITLMPPAFSAGFLEPTYPLSISYESKAATVQVPNYSAGKSLSSVPVAIEAPIGGEVEFWIEKSNPVLFSYTPGKPSEQATDNAAALQTLANALKKFASLAPPPLPPGAPAASCKPKFLFGDLNVDEFEKRIVSFVGIKPELMAAIDATTRDDFQSYRDKLAQWKKTGQAFQAALVNYRDVSDPVAPATIPFTFCPDAPLATEITGVANILTLKTQLRNATTGQPPAVVKAIQDAEERVDVLLFLRTEIDRFDKVAVLTGELIGDLANAGNRKKLPVTVKVNPNKNITQPFTISANDKYGDFLTPATKQYQKDVASTGERAVVISPDDNFRVSIAPGVFYSFVRNPEYSVTQQGSQLVISQKSNDFNSVSGMVALDITKKAWAGQSFTPHIQVGVAPDKDKLAFVLGGGFQSTTGVSMSMGIIYQKTTQLKSGLSVGQVISSANDLQTEKTFKPGFYIGVNYDFKL